MTDPTDDLPARLEVHASGTPHMDGTSTVALPKYHDKPGQVLVTLPGPVLADLCAAAARIRELEAWTIEVVEANRELGEENVRLTRLANSLADFARGHMLDGPPIDAWDNRAVDMPTGTES